MEEVGCWFRKRSRINRRGSKREGSWAKWIFARPGCQGRARESRKMEVVREPRRNLSNYAGATRAPRSLDDPREPLGNGCSPGSSSVHGCSRVAPVRSLFAPRTLPSSILPNERLSTDAPAWNMLIARARLVRNGVRGWFMNTVLLRLKLDYIDPLEGRIRGLLVFNFSFVSNWSSVVAK